MSTPQSHWSVPGVVEASRRRKLITVLVVDMVIALTMMAVSFLMAQGGGWQHRIVGMLMTAWFLAFALAWIIAVVRPAWIRVALWLVIFASNVILLATTFFIAGLGLIAGVVLFLGILLLSVQTLDRLQAVRAALSASIFGAATIMTDIFLPRLAPAIQRLQVTVWVQTVLVVAAGLGMLVWSLSLLWNYPFRSVRPRLLTLFLVFALVPLWTVALAFFTLTREMLPPLYALIGLGLLAAFTSIAGLASITIGGLLSRPIAHMAKVAGMVSSGDYYALARLERSDELGLIAQVFDQVVEKLREVIYELEQRIAERSTLQQMAERSLYQADQLRAVAEIARVAASVQSLDRLLPEVAVRISEAFGYYHVGIFLLDEAGKYAVLRAASSEGGKQMLARGHRLEVGQVGIVGYVTATGKSRIALDVGDDAVYFQNPDLPYTRSEAAIPLKVGERIIGALDVQSTKPEAFRREDIEILSAVGDQIALAIENTRLYESTRRSLAEAETFYRQFLQREWGRLQQEERLGGFCYTLSGVTVLLEEATLPAEIQEKMLAGEIYRKMAGSTDEPAELAVPLRLRGETIGVLHIAMPGGQLWTEEGIELIRAVADRLALAMENARLFEQTVRRADRERAVADITAKIRSATDPQIMLQIAVEELRQVLGAQEIRIRTYAPTGESQVPPFIEPPSGEPPSSDGRDDQETLL